MPAFSLAVENLDVLTRELTPDDEHHGDEKLGKESGARAFNLDMSTPSAKFESRYEIWKDKLTGLWHLRFLLPNGKAAVTSTGFPRKTDCIGAVMLLRASEKAQMYDLNPEIQS